MKKPDGLPSFSPIDGDQGAGKVSVLASARHLGDRPFEQRPPNLITVAV